jgi:amidophosphoribosyltransferase
MPSRDELLGAMHSVEEITAILGVDSLGYLSLEGMLAAVEELGPFCDACFSGEYCTPLVDQERGLVTILAPPGC